jgi:hypothetical protein
MQSLSTDEGIQIEDSNEQCRNAESSMHSNFESNSNVTIERDSHSKKQFSQSFSTEDGTQIDESGERL